MMRAVAVFPGTREVRLIEHAVPAITRPTDVLLRMLEVGVCGTDRELCNFAFGSAPAGADHFILGHESLAEVAAVGAAVDTVAPGDLVIGIVRKPCAAACPACRAGRPDFCGSLEYLERGIQALDGFMTEFIVEEARYLHRVPSQLRDVAVLVEPLTIAEKALAQYREIARRTPWLTQPATALVLGAGPIGLLGAMLLQVAGFVTCVYSREGSSSRNARIAEGIGARYVSTADATPAELAALTGRPDLVYEAMGAPPITFEVLDQLGGGGVFVFTGVPAAGVAAQVDSHRLLLNLILRNQAIVGTVNAGSDAFAAATSDLAEFARRWPDALAMLVTARYPIEQFRNAIFASGGLKSVVTLCA